MDLTAKLSGVKNINLIIIFVFGFILYGNSLFNDYALDDAIVITKNEFTKKGISGIAEILSTDGFRGFFGKDKQLVAGGRYRPLSLVTFAIEYQFFGLNPFISHLINIILYVLTSYLLFLILAHFSPDSLSKNKLLNIPFVVALLFLAHPIHTEVVANIKGRDEIMTLLGALYALYLSIKYLETSKISYFVYVTIVFFLALMSKENAITFVAIIPLSIYYFSKVEVRKNLIIFAAISVSTIIYMIIRTTVIGSTYGAQSTELMNNPYINSSFTEQIATNFYTMGLYIKLLIFPHPLTFDYYPKQIPIINFTDFRAIISLLFYVFIGVIAVLGFKRKTVVSYGIWFYLLSFSVVSNIVFNVGTFMNERFMFISSIGFIIIVVYYLFKYLSSKNIKILFTLILLILVGFTAKTIERNRAWDNDYVLFTTDVLTSTNSAKSNTSAGGKMLETVGTLKAILHDNPTNKQVIIEKLYETDLRNSEVEEIINANDYKGIIKNINNKITNLQKQLLKYLEKAVEIHPEYNDALILLGNAYYDKDKDVEKTWAAYKRILDHSPGYKRVFQNLDIVLNDSVDVDLRIDIWTQARKYNPGRYNTNYQLGRLYGRYKNNLDTSIYFLSVALGNNNKKHEAWKDLGTAYGIKADIIANDKSQGYEKAKPYYQKALSAMNSAYKLKPDDEQLLMNIGVTHMKLQDYNNAINIFENAYKKNPTSGDIINNLYLTYVNAKQYEKARLFMLNLLKSNPNNFTFNFNLANIYRQSGKIQEANRYYEIARKINPQLFAQYTGRR